MGRTITPSYRVELMEHRIGSCGPAVSRMGWDGRPTVANLERYVFAYVDGGVNVHLSESLGYIPIPHSARIVRQKTGRIVASWQAAMFQAF